MSPDARPPLFHSSIIMRIALAFIIVLIGANIGITAMNKVQSIQDQKMDRLCKIDPDLCDNIDPRS